MGAMATASVVSDKANVPFNSVKDSSKKKFLSLLLLLLLVAAPSYGLLSLSKNKFGRSEISQAEQSREMSLRNDYISSSYHYMPQIDKPGMVFWLVIPAFKAFGEHPFSARIQSIVAALATLTILAFALRAAFGWQSALMAAMVLATAQRFMEFTSLCMVDMLLTCFDLGTLVALYASSADEKHRGRWFALAGVCSACAVLTKGPVGLVLPAACFGLWLVVTKQIKVILDKRLLIGLASFIAVASPWYILVASHMPGPTYVLDWLYHHNIERYFGNAYAFTHPPYYMIESFFLGFAPWSVLIPFAFVASIKKWRKAENLVESRCELLMWMWIVIVIAFFENSKGKMNYYDLPCFTAAASLTGIHLTRWINTRARTGQVFGWVLAVALFVVGGISCYLLPHITGPEIQNWVMAPLALFIPAAFVVYSMWRGNLFKAYATAGLAILLALFSFSAQALPAIGKQIPALDYLYQIKADKSDYKLAMHSDFAITVDWVDHGLFITGHIPDTVNNTKAVTDFLNQKQRVYLILPANRFAELPEELRSRVKVLQNRPYISDKLGLQYLLTCHGNLCGPVPLLLVTNDQTVQ
jgi:4-amino-4-deoxy-L-arabinose transferase-like glycosyltransferase